MSIPVEDLRKLKTLLNEGIITAEEFKESRDALLQKGLSNNNDAKNDVEIQERRDADYFDEAYLNGCIVDENDLVGKILLGINNRFSYFGKEALEKACESYKNGIIGDNHTALLEYDKVLYSRALSREIGDAKKQPNRTPSDCGDEYLKVLADVDVISTPFSHYLERTRIARLGYEKLIEKAAEHSEFKHNPPTEEELHEAQDIAHVAMAFALELESTFHYEISRMDPVKKSALIDNIGLEILSFTIWYLQDENNSKILCGDSNDYRMVMERWNSYEDAVVGKRNCSSWTRSFLTQNMIDDLTDTWETTALLALGESLSSVVDSLDNKNSFSFHNKKKNSLEFRIFKFLVVKYKEFLDAI